MKEVIFNDDNLKEEDITEVVTRVKALLINDKDEVLLGYAHDLYQFIGGHVEDNEDLNIALKREIKEEAGIELDTNNIKPFMRHLGYYKDYPKENENRKVIIYYYKIHTNLKPNLSNTNYTEDEKKGDFKLIYIKLVELKEILSKRSNNRRIGIAKEMLEVLKQLN